MEKSHGNKPAIISKVNNSKKKFRVRKRIGNGKLSAKFDQWKWKI